MVWSSDGFSFQSGKTIPQAMLNLYILGLLKVKLIKQHNLIVTIFKDALRVMKYFFKKRLTSLLHSFIAMEFLKTNRKHVFNYQLWDPASFKEELAHSLSYDYYLIEKKQFSCWRDLAKTLCS